MTSRPDLLDLQTVATSWKLAKDEERLPIILGKRGSVSAHDLITLNVYVSGRCLAKVLKALPVGWKRHQIGEDEANLLAPVSDLDRACRTIRASRKRRKTGGRDFTPRDRGPVSVPKSYDLSPSHLATRS